MKLLQTDTEDAQNTLADYCRTGKTTIVPGARQNKLHHYRRLVFNVINSTLEQAYPITYQLLNDKEWHTLIDSFFSNHDCQTPQVWKLPFEFYEYVKQEDFQTRLGQPCLNDLLYFEWIEIEIHTMPDQKMPQSNSTGDLLNDPFAVNPEFQIIVLNYPIHMFPAKEAQQRKGKYFVLIYRMTDSGKVKFMDLPPLYVFMLEKTTADFPLREILKEAVQLFSISDEKKLKENAVRFFEDLISEKVILGYQT